MTLGAAYEYDQLNRLKQTGYYDIDPQLTGTDGFYATPEYFNSYSYDQNGKMKVSPISFGLSPTK